MGISLAGGEFWPAILKLSDYLIDLQYDGRLLSITQTLTIVCLSSDKHSHFPFKMDFCSFPLLCVFGNPIEEAKTQSENQSTLSFGIYLFHGRWLNMVPLNTQAQWEPYYLLNISGNVYTEHGAQQVAPTPILTAKPLKWQMHRPPKLHHLAPAVDIFKVNI
jgi:hypothetical protein